MPSFGGTNRRLQAKRVSSSFLSDVISCSLVQHDEAAYRYCNHWKLTGRSDVDPILTAAF